MSTEDLNGVAAERDGPTPNAVSGTVASMTLSLGNGQRMTAAGSVRRGAVAGDSVGPST